MTTVHKHTNGHSDTGAINARLQNLEGDLIEIRNITSRKETPWAVLIAAAAFIVGGLGAAGGWALSVVNRDIDSVQRQVSANALMLTQIPASRIDRVEADITELSRQVQLMSMNQVPARMERNEKDIQEIRLGMVPRGEHLGHWEAEVKDVANLANQIETLRHDFGGTFSLRDEIVALNNRLQRIEDNRLKLQQ